jgi:A/G-specific adenine glycosylase
VSEAVSSPNPLPDSLPGDKLAARLVRELEAWYEREARDLPWRHTRDPYAIWISEAMLQQTRVQTVLDYWPRFLERFPDASALAAAEEEAVLEAWSGLGYYRRARSLRSAAQVIVRRHAGRFPSDLEAVLALPGIGPYTAGAVLSIAHDQPEALVDGNVERVFARLFGLELESGSPAIKRRAWELARHLVPLAKRPGQWNQALMELGATLCTAAKASCLLCPLRTDCAATAAGDPTRLPLPKPKRKPTQVRVRMAWVTRGAEILLERRPSSGRMAGLWQLPTVEVPGPTPAQELFPEPFAADLELQLGDCLHELRHSITRFAIQVSVHAAEAQGAPQLEPAGPYRWVPQSEAASLALTGMTKKALVAAIGAAGRVR